MVQHRTFMEMRLDDEGLHTPDGVFKLESMTKAVIVRNRVRPTDAGGSEYAPADAVGGALIGGAIAGPIGFIGGGLLGSSIRHKHESDSVPRTVSASLMFESPEAAYVTRVSRDRVEEAEAFVKAVREGAGL
jgi:hypothetical protein